MSTPIKFCRLEWIELLQFIELCEGQMEWKSAELAIISKQKKRRTLYNLNRWHQINQYTRVVCPMFRLFYLMAWSVHISKSRTVI